MRIKTINYDIKTDINVENKKIVLISDIHYEKNYNLKILDKLYSKINELKPDFVCITGDLVDTVLEYDNLEINHLVKFIKDLGTITVVLISIGNHDVKYFHNLKWKYKFNEIWFERINKLNNVYVLDNSSKIVGDYNFIGYTIPFDYYYNRERDTSYIENSIHDILKLSKKNKYNILLSHSPIGIIKENIYDKYIKNSNFNLILSGHTHGGLMPSVIPGNWGIISPYKSFFPKNVRGIINKEVPIIISYGVMKLSKTAKIFHLFNGLYPVGMEVININNQ